MVETTSAPDRDEQGPSDRFRKLPERIRPEDMTAAQDTEPPPDLTLGRDLEHEFMMRNMGA